MAEAPAPAPRPGARARTLRRAALAVAALALLAAWAGAALQQAGAPRSSLHVDGEGGLRELAAALRTEGFAVEALASGPHALDALGPPARAVLVVAGVERSYSQGEVAAIVGFVERGGTAVVADDFGFGDAVGEPFGVNFDRRVLRDAAFQVNVSLVRVTAAAGGANHTVVLNVPGSLGFAPRVDARVLAWSGDDSYMDENLNGVEDPTDVKGPFPVIAAIARGQGRAVFMSDPGLLLDGLAPTNGPFLRAFFRELLPQGGTVALDESRHPLGAPGAALGALLAGEVQATSEPATALLAGAGAAVLAAAAFLAFQPPEDISAHRSRLGDPVHASGPEAARRRLRALAARAAAQAQGLSIDETGQRTPEELAAKVQDPVLQALLRGQPVKEDDRALLQRIEAMGGARGARP